MSYDLNNLKLSLLHVCLTILEQTKMFLMKHIKIKKIKTKLAFLSWFKMNVSISKYKMQH